MAVALDDWVFGGVKEGRVIVTEAIVGLTQFEVTRKWYARSADLIIHSHLPSAVIVAVPPLRRATSARRDTAMCRAPNADS